MKVLTKGVLFSAFIAISGSTFAQGMNGGAAEAKGAAGTSNSSGEKSTIAPSGKSGANPTGSATNSGPKKSHKKSGTATPASATNPGSGGS